MKILGCDAARQMEPLADSVADPVRVRERIFHQLLLSGQAPAAFQGVIVAAFDWKICVING
jgi:hypothetical protein